jgi:lipopolysaccharide export system permease protein
MREMEKRADFFLDIKQDKIWYRSKNMIYNLQRFDARSKTIVGMAVYTFDENFNLIQVVDAERAEFGENGNWKLLDGTVTLFSKSDPFPMTQRFKEKALQIAETPRDFQEIEKEVDGLRLKELYRYIQRMKSAGADTKGYEVKLQSRISLSFIPLVMCVLGVPFSTRGRREGGTAKDFFLCLIITFFYWLFYSLGLSLGTNGALPPWVAAWLPSSVFGVLAAVLVARKR